VAYQPTSPAITLSCAGNWLLALGLVGGLLPGFWLAGLQRGCDEACYAWADCAAVLVCSRAWGVLSRRSFRPSPACRFSRCHQAHPGKSWSTIGRGSLHSSCRLLGSVGENGVFSGSGGRGVVTRLWLVGWARLSCTWIVRIRVWCGSFGIGWPAGRLGCRVFFLSLQF